MTAASLLSTAAHALPQGGQVVGGQATIATSGSQTTITQSTHRGIINWQSFDIAHGEHVTFQQPSSSSITLNRITGGGGASQIMGSLSANGTVMLVNPNGIFFGASSQVNVGGLVATTADVSDDRFLAGDMRFDIPGNPNAGIVNQGLISVADAGLVAFVAPNVVNDGLIQAKLGKVQLASGDTFALDLYGDGLVSLEASDAITSQLVSNSGIISAQGGTVTLTAAAAGEVVNSLINMDGIIQATSVAEHNGEIVIYAEGSNAVAGNDPTQKGQRTGSSTVLVSGVLDASGRNPGERGGNITVTGDNVALLNGTFIDASGHTGLSGTTAGQAVSAYREGSAGGDIRIGGDYLGQGDTPTAQNLYVDSGALIINDSLFTGDAGRTIFWSDGTTQFYGNVYARALGGNAVDPLTWNATAGGNAGDGGFVETSGHNHLDAGGYVNLTASSGNKGTYFLDPTDITIYGNVDPAFVSTDGTIDLASSLRLWLDASDTSKVTLTYLTNGLSSATATGTSGSNTITTSSDVSANLAVGARIRLGSGGTVTTAATMGADTYTIASISGTTITTAETLTSTYTGSALYRGLVSQWSDNSGQGNNATQATAANMPLWISNGQNGFGAMKFDGGDNLTVSGFFRPVGDASIVVGLTYQSITGPGGYGLTGWQEANAYLYVGVQGSNAQSYSYLGTGLAGTLGGTLSTNTPYLQYGVNQGTAGTTYLNGAVDASNTAGAGGAGSSNYLIGRVVASHNLSATMFENIVYGAALSGDTLALVNQYQSAKWGIALTPPGTGATEAAKATASDGYSVFTTRYLERLSQSANISLQATNNINLDFKGDTLNFSTAGRSLTLTAGNQITTVSTGAITTNNGNISLTGTNGILLNHAYTLNSNGGNVSLNNPVTLGANQTINAGSGTLTFGGTVNGANNLTATAGTFSFGGDIGGTTPLAAVSLTSTNGLTLPSITASSIFARSTGASSDLTIASGKTLTATGSGTAITLASGRNFINNAGSGALSTPSGRWLVYSTNPANDTIGGLSANFRLGSCTYGGSCPSIPDSGNGFLYSDSVSFTTITASEAARIQFAHQRQEPVVTGQPEPSYTKPSGTEESQADTADTNPQDLAPAQGQPTQPQLGLISVDPAAQVLFDLPPYL